MAVDLFGISYTVEYWNVNTCAPSLHDESLGINLSNDSRIPEDKQCAFIHVKTPDNNRGFTDLYMLVEGPPRNTDMFDAVGGSIESGDSVSLEDALKVYVKLNKGNDLWPRIGLIFPEDIGLDNSVIVEEAIYALANRDLYFSESNVLDNDLTFDHKAAIYTLMGVASAVTTGSSIAGVPGNVVEDTSDYSGDIAELTSNDNLKRMVTKAAVAGNIFNSFQDCATQSAYGFLFDCLAKLQSATQGEIDSIGAAVMAVISGINNQIDAAIDLIQTAAILPLTHALKSFLDPLVSNGKYLADAYSKFMAKVDGVVGSLPLGMLVEMGKCMAKDPTIAPLLRTKDYVLGVAKDGLIYDEALNLLDNGYPEVGSLRHSILTLTSTRGSLFRGPVAKLIWGSATSKYMAVLGATSSQDAYMSALNAIPAEHRLSWPTVSSIMKKHTTVQSSTQFETLKDSIELPDYIAWDSIDDDGVTDDDGDGVVSFGLEEITDELLRISITDINMSAIEYTLYELDSTHKSYKGLLLNTADNYAEAQSDYEEAVDIRDAAISAGTDSGGSTTPLYIAMQAAKKIMDDTELLMNGYSDATANAWNELQDIEGVHEEATRILGMLTAGDRK